MRSTLALVHASWRSAASYRLRLVLSILSLAGTIVPIYFVAHALQPVVATSISNQGGEYFAFVVVGMVTFLLLPAALNALPGEIGSGVNTGMLEALMGTPTRLPATLTGLIGFNLLWTMLRAVVLLLAGWLLGAHLIWSRFGLASLILGLTVAAYVGIGLLSSALVIAFRTAGPLNQSVLALSGLLGGVYYPTTVIPSWIGSISDFIPLTYGLRALRASLLEGNSIAQILPDVAVLSMFAIGLMAVASLAFNVALRYARRAGTLAHY
jgi:ABC-2 type transport system permease protein